jgi:hypothetical protein
MGVGFEQQLGVCAPLWRRTSERMLVAAGTYKAPASVCQHRQVWNPCGKRVWHDRAVHYFGTVRFIATAESRGGAAGVVLAGFCQSFGGKGVMWLS